MSHEDATMYRVLGAIPDPTPETRRLLDAANPEKRQFPADDHGRWLAELANRLTTDPRTV